MVAVWFTPSTNSETCLELKLGASTFSDAVESWAKTRVGETAKESTTIQQNPDTSSLRLGIEVILHFPNAWVPPGSKPSRIANVFLPTVAHHSTNPLALVKN